MSADPEARRQIAVLKDRLNGVIEGATSLVEMGRIQVAAIIFLLQAVDVPQKDLVEWMNAVGEVDAKAAQAVMDRILKTRFPDRGGPAGAA